MGATEVKTRYSDSELEEFKVLILEKKEKAEKEYNILKKSADEIELTPIGFKVQEEGSSALSKDEALKLAKRQLNFVQHLNSALTRIENKTYGICRDTGKLIPKGRLMAVPHATLSVEAKENRN